MSRRTVILGNIFQERERKGGLRGRRHSNHYSFESLAPRFTTARGTPVEDCRSVSCNYRKMSHNTKTKPKKLQ